MSVPLRTPSRNSAVGKKIVLKKFLFDILLPYYSTILVQKISLFTISSSIKKMSYSRYVYIKLSNIKISNIFFLEYDEEINQE